MNSIKKNQIIISALAIMIAVAAYLSFSEKSDLNEEQYVFKGDYSNSTQDGQDAIVPNLEKGSEVDTTVPDAENSKQDAESNQQETSATITEGEAENKTEEEAKETTTDGKENTEGVSPTEGEENTSQETAKNNESVGEAVFVSHTPGSPVNLLESKIDREQTRAARIDVLLEIINNKNLGENEKVKAASKMIELQDRIEKESSAESLLEAKGFENVFVRLDDVTVDVIVKIESLTDVQLAQITDIVSRKTGVKAENVIISPISIESEK